MSAQQFGDGQMDGASLRILEFCAAEKVSRSELYKLWNQGRCAERPFGKGPRFFFVGVSKRISPEARADWRREREAEAAQLLAEGA
jgi:hypothetical protein